MLYCYYFCHNVTLSFTVWNEDPNVMVRKKIKVLERRIIGNTMIRQSKNKLLIIWWCCGWISRGYWLTAAQEQFSCWFSMLIFFLSFFWISHLQPTSLTQWWTTFQQISPLESTMAGPALVMGTSTKWWWALAGTLTTKTPRSPWLVEEKHHSLCFFSLKKKHAHCTFNYNMSKKSLTAQEMIVWRNSKAHIFLHSLSQKLSPNSINDIKLVCKY